MRLLIYTPTYDDLMRPEMVASIQAQETDVPYVWHVDNDNPFPGRQMRNVVAKYQRAQQMALDGGYDALLTVEHDMVLPSNAIEKLWNTDAPVVYGIYMLRHGTKTLNAWQYVNNRNLGMSLSLYPEEVRKARYQGWIEVCGVGWGCTLIRRDVLQRVWIHSNNEADAGDLTFGTDCVRNGIRQIARFDVPCGHIEPNGNVLEPFAQGGIVARVYAIQSINCNVDGQSIPLKKGRYYTLPAEVGRELARAGFVIITNEERETADVQPVVETAVATVTKRKPKPKAA